MSATRFDPLKGAREELSGLVEIQRVLVDRRRQAEEAMSRAENELNALRKIAGYLAITMDAVRQRIAELEKAERVQ